MFTRTLPAVLTEPWPDDVVARYLTQAGTTVDITDNGEGAPKRYHLDCGGCPMGRDVDHDSTARADAQNHAEKCRSIRRPTL